MALRKKKLKTIWKTACHRTFWHNPFKSLQKYEFSYVCKHIGFPALAVFPLPFTSAPAALRSSDFSMYPGLKSSINPIHPIQEAKFPQIAGEIFLDKKSSRSCFWGVGNIHENISEKNWKHTFFWVRKEFRRVLPLLHGFERCSLPFTNVVEVPSDDGYINPVTPVV